MKLKAFKIVIDTSSLIYLEYANLLNFVLLKYKVFTFYAVLKEFRRKSDKKLININFLKSGSITDTGDECIIKFFSIKNNRKNFVLLTDDGKLCNFAKRNNIFYINSLRMPYFIYKDFFIDYKNILKYFAKIKFYGYYSNRIINFAENELINLIKERGHYD